MCIFGLVKMMEHDDANEHFPPGQTIVMLDILGSLERAIVRPPSGLWDAYAISMLTSIVASARWSKALFRERHMTESHAAELPDNHHEIGHAQYSNASVQYQITTDPKAPSEENTHDFHEIRFQVPEAHWPNMMTWSYSNLKLCYDIGLETGRAWLAENGDRLPDREKGSVNAVGSTTRATVPASAGHSRGHEVT
jgi:hypothetical protein